MIRVLLSRSHLLESVIGSGKKYRIHQIGFRGEGTSRKSLSENLAAGSRITRN